MARRTPPPRARTPRAEPLPKPAAEPRAEVRPSPIRPRVLALSVVALLGFHYFLAAVSLVRENPTVDEVNHLPAGVTYWQTGKFKLYHHNPPLIKLVAALPVVASGAEMGPLYGSPAWRSATPPPALFGHGFMSLNARNYFELFTLARLVMPLFSVLGGLGVFLWSRRLWGDRGGVLSLVLWCLCPNILAHARLVTSDAAAASIGLAATYAFWLYLHAPTWRRAAVAGVVLGLAQLTKFSLLLLYGIWPLLWLAREVALFERAGVARRWLRAIGQGAAIVGLSVLVIDVGYGFEGVGRKLGTFDFASRSFLTRNGPTLNPDGSPKRADNQLIGISWKHRVNRFRGTPFASWPSPLPSEYLLGFDEQKIEADGLPRAWYDPGVTDETVVEGYPVYLDGVLRRHGWRDYYARALLYKTPEGTLFLVGLSLVVLVAAKRCRAPWPDEVALYAPPLCVFVAMSFLTDINLGVRYVLPILPYLFVGCGRLAPWMCGRSAAGRPWVRFWVGVPLVANLMALAIHPHYLSYFNAIGGGPDRVPPRLIDSNLDWGQDLVGLRRWLVDHDEKAPIGLAYFGQVTPNLFVERGEGFPWFVPPASPGTIGAMMRDTSALQGPAERLEPGLYAVSASLVQGLPWRVYDPSPRVWAGTWKAEKDAFGYFRQLEPFDRVGHSILLYRVTEGQAARINARLAPR